MSTPEIIKSANRLKRDIVRKNDEALKTLIRSYTVLMKSLQSQLKEINALIKEAEREGKHAVLREPGSKTHLKENEYSVNWLFRQQRYEELISQCKTRINEYVKSAELLTYAQQMMGIKRGISDTRTIAMQSLGTPPPQVARLGLSVSWNTIPADAVTNIVGFLSDGSPLSYKFAGMSNKVADGVKDRIVSGFAQGWNPRKIARAVKKEFGNVLDNALMTCRTETMRAYREAVYQSDLANSDILKGNVRMAAKNARTCAACWALDGTFYPLGKRLDDHVCGRCILVPITKSYQELFPELDLSHVQDNSIQPWDSEQYFKQLSDKDQLKVLGRRRYDLYKAGKIKLADIPSVRKSKKWGDVPVPGRIDEVLARAQARKEASS